MSEIDDDDIIDPKVEKRLNQTAATLTITANQALRKKIEADVEAFLKAGGKITKIKTGLSADPVTFFIKPLASKEQQRLAYEHRRGVKRERRK